ncbi:MAG: glycosyl transferase, partial [Bryobacteraceae bacterium]
RHLPRQYYKILPTLNSQGATIRVSELTYDLVTQTNHTLNEANIVDFVGAYQTVEPLNIAELWALPLLLRLALIEALARFAQRISAAQQLREAAYFWANRLAAGVRQGPEVFTRILNRMEMESVALKPHFVSCLAEQLQGEENALAPLQHWLEERLQTPLTEVVSSEHAQEAAERASIANAFKSLRAFAQIEFANIFESVSLVEAELRQDPAGNYPESDFPTRDQCRRMVEDISRRSGSDELIIARTAVELAAAADDARGRLVASYLLSDRIVQLESKVGARLPLRRKLTRGLRRNATPFYLTAVAALTISFLAITMTLAWDMGVRNTAIRIVLCALAAFPLSELALQIINALVISLLPPDKLPKMDFQHGIPPRNSTLVMIPMMLSSAEVVQHEIEKLEVRFLGNQESNLWFGLFADFTDAETESAAGDDALVRVAHQGIEALNKRYPGDRFVLFHRPRSWSETEQRWIGRERKRGKIEDLNAYLCGEGPADLLAAGRLPPAIRYVISLDADTQLPPGAARRMIETIAHPLNQVEIDPVTRVRRRGFTIIQPRVSIPLPGATATRFTQVFADTTGTDPYCQSVSDAHQDLFGQAGFLGKAIYDVPAFHAILGRRFPPETLLSHDLIEGAHAGVALASDIELFESLPLDYSSYSQREHRWIRGDWQIAPWIFPRVPSADGGVISNPLTAIGRWRIFDNLRRSLVPVASLLLLLLGWLISAAPGVWSLVVGVAVAIPAIAPLLDRVARRLQGAVRSWHGAGDEIARAVVTIALLPHQAWVTVDAIARVLYRRHVTHRNLLEWKTAEMAQASSGQHVSATPRQLLIAAAASAVLTIVLYVHGEFAPTGLFTALWIVSPAIVKWLAVPVPTRHQHRVTGADAMLLRNAARRTWRYFDDLVTPSTHWLPPDNSQLALRIEVAQRTSPTNIGLWLTSALAAFDLGYLTLDDFEYRCSQTMATLDRLEQYEGHLLNWYDTGTLEPLRPRYVSTVDSGNLLASLWVFEQGCSGAVTAPLLGRLSLTGLADTLAALAEVCGNDSSVAAPLKELGRLCRGDADGYDIVSRLRLALVPGQQLAHTSDWHVAPGDERNYWVSCLVRELAAWLQMADRYVPWMETLAAAPDSFLRILGEGAVKLRRQALTSMPSLTDLAKGTSKPMNALLAMRRTPQLPPPVSAWLNQVAAEYERARTNAAQAVENLRTAAAKAGRLADGIDMRFLYDTKTRLFGIGYAVGGPLEFNSHYDLLASECRLASLAAIAKGDVPVEHWFALGRPRASSGTFWTG